MKPLLAVNAELDKLNFPLYASPKLDGIRCLLLETGEAVSRRLKPIPNHYVRETLAGYGKSYLDGELVTYTEGRLDNYNEIQSKIMSHDGCPDFQLLVFDWFGDPNLPYDKRYDTVYASCTSPVFSPVKQVRINQLETLMDLHAGYLSQGYEGTMTRRIDGHYKFGV